MATCLDVAGVEYPKKLAGRDLLPLEGRSLLPILEGKKVASQDLFWEHEGNRAMRSGKWKLVSRYDQTWELYDMEADRTELHDLAAKQPDTVKELRAKYERWADRVGVQPWEKIESREL